MGNPSGVKRDFEQLEKRRFKAAELLKQGVSQAEVARRLTVHRQSVSRWAKQLGVGGKSSLRFPGRAGAKPRLATKELRRIEDGLKQGPETLGYSTGLWTCERVADLIQRRCGVQYHPGHVWRILRSLRWSCQRPTGRAIERNEKAIRYWKKQRWPDIKKKPSPKGE
jgi:transposase